MRLKIILSPEKKECTIPINYQHFLSSAIYRILRAVDEEYANDLHDKGLKSKNGKSIKLFTFSYLFTPSKEIKNKHLIIRDHHLCYFYISSPLIDSFVKNVVIGLFEKQKLIIQNEIFNILKIEPVALPEFSNEMQFRCLSPFVLSTMCEHNGSLTPHYIRPNEEGLSEAAKNNLINKFTTLYQKQPEHNQIQLKLDENYIKTRNPNRLTKLITLKEGHGKHETKIRGIFVPFRLSGSVELMQIAWDAGLGTHCSQGFGCIDFLSN